MLTPVANLTEGAEKKSTPKRNCQKHPHETVARIEAKTKVGSASVDPKKNIIKGFSSVFQDSLGRCTKMKTNVQPVFRPKRPVPFSPSSYVEEELSHVEKN